MVTRRILLTYGAAGAAAAALLARVGLAGEAKSPEKIGIAYALGGRGDRSYNDAAATNVEVLQRTFEVLEYAPMNSQDYPRSLAVLAEHSPRVVFCVGYVYDVFVDQLADRYDRTMFYVLDGSPSKKPNVAGIKFRVNEAASLAGALAAARSRTGILGFVGGTDIPPIREFLDGYKSGAESVNPQVKIIDLYAGSGAQAFIDPTKGKDLGLRLIRRGADILFHAAGTTGTGMIDAARQQGKLAIGVDVDQSSLAPGTVFTSVLKRLDVAIQRITEALEKGGPLPESSISLGLKEGGVGIVPPALLSPAEDAALHEIKLRYGAS